ncbi:MAG: nucleotidyltransferase domain-containing protein [Clostridiaceae bacterium]|nr:nucleotidyltransferase domain-containing protein [Clostridiaceae bacterium]
MFRIDEYVDKLTNKLIDVFGERLEYIGLQGSYLRHEETKNSDIDIMVVIDNISVEDLNTYQKALVSIGNYDKSCGFICGKTDLEHWNPLEIQETSCEEKMKGILLFRKTGKVEMLQKDRSESEILGMKKAYKIRGWKFPEEH